MIAAIPRRIRSQRGQQIGSRAPLKGGRQHTNHREGLRVQGDRSPDHARVGTERALPQAVAHHDHARVAAGPILFGREVAAERRRDSQRGQEGRRDVQALNDLGVTVGGRQRESRVVGRRHRLHARGLRAEVEEVGMRYRERRPAALDVALPDPDQAVGFAKGSGRSITVLTTLKIAALAPTPSARVMAATTVNPGLFRSDRAAYRTSCSHDIIATLRSGAFDDVRAQTVINGGDSCRAGQSRALSSAQRARGGAEHL